MPPSERDCVHVRDALHVATADFLYTAPRIPARIWRSSADSEIDHTEKDSVHPVQREHCHLCSHFVVVAGCIQRMCYVQRR